MLLKLRNNFKKGDRLPVTVENNRIILHSITSDNTLDITDLIEDKQDVLNILHIKKAIAVVKDRDNINICYYFQFHVHSQYSILDGMSHLKDIAKKSSGITAVTDHGNMFALLKWQEAMNKVGKIPVFGTEAYVENYIDGEKESRHLILLAKNEVGKKNLFLLSSNSFHNFYRKPHVSIEDLKLYHEGVICTSACLGGEISSLLMHDRYDDAKKVADFYKSIFKDDYYLEIQNHGIKEELKVNPLILKLGAELGIKVVAANDSHYIDKEDDRYHETLLCVNSKSKMNESHFSFNGTGYHYMTDAEITNMFWDKPEVISNTLEIAEKCNLVIETGKYHMPVFPIPEEFSDDVEYLHYLITKGYDDRYKGTEHYDNEVYRNRLNYEENVINTMGFASYFLIVQDYIMWAKKAGIYVGPGRGSAAGSLVAYCLKITDLDPIKHDLLFERFLNPDRISMPDIDVDFADNRRHEVVNYCKKKYGTDRVCNIITFGTMQSKMAIQDVARVFDCSELGNRVKKLIPSTSKNIKDALNESEELKSLYNTDNNAKSLIDISSKLESSPRNTSTHACGIVIADAPVKNYLPTAMVKDSNSEDKDAKALATQVTMTEVEELGILKMDFLGLKTMTVIGSSLDGVNELRSKKGQSTFSYYREIPINDPYVYAEISKGNSYAVFQIESAGMRSFMSQLFEDVNYKISIIEKKYGFTGFGDSIIGDGSSDELLSYKKEMESFGDELFERMIAGVSLYRPGPMDYIPDYLKNLNNPDDIVYDTPELEPILKPTYGVIVFQEQVIQIVKALAGFTAGQADLIRKAMGKKREEILDEYKPYFIYGSGDNIDSHTELPLNIRGCVVNNIDENVASLIWDKMKDFGKYAFNKSHAAVYSVLTVTCAWLKHYYPAIYMTAMLNAYIEGQKLAGYINVVKKMGIPILPPDINESCDLFSTDGNQIRFGFKGIKGLSKTVSVITEERKNGKYKGIGDFIDRTYSLGFKKSGTEALIYTGAFDSFSCSRKAKINAIASIYDGEKKDKNIPGQTSLFDSFLSDYNKIVIEDEPEFSKQEILLKEKEISGMYISEHPLDSYENILNQYNISEISLLDDSDDETQDINGMKISVAGIINDIKIFFTKKDHRPMASITIEDRGGEINAVIFPDDYTTAAPLLVKNKTVVVKGVLQNNDFGLQIICNSVFDIDSLSKPESQHNVYIRLNSLDEIPKTEAFLGEHQGNTNVYVQVDKQLYKLNVNIKESASTYMALQNEFGTQNVKLV